MERPLVRPLNIDWFHHIARRSALRGLTRLFCSRGAADHDLADHRQLVINTATTIIVFLIQNTPNRDAQAVHLKLDELIRGVKGARNALIDLADLSDQELDQLRESFMKLAKQKER